MVHYGSLFFSKESFWLVASSKFYILATLCSVFEFTNPDLMHGGPFQSGNVNFFSTFWLTFWLFLPPGLRLSFWLAPVFPHFGSSHSGWHRRGLSYSSRSQCNKGIAWHEGGGPAVFPWLPKATVQDKEAWQNLHGWRKRMFWDEDGPNWLHQWAWLLGLQQSSQFMTSDTKLTLHDPLTC